MAQFQGQNPNGVAVQQLEVLVRTAVFKPATALVGQLLQGAADRIDAAYQPQPGQHRKGREAITKLLKRGAEAGLVPDCGEVEYVVAK